MDTTTLVVIFLAFVSVTVVTNTLIIFFAYKGFANLTMKVTEAAREFETSGATRQWIKSLEKTAEQAVSVTEAAKQKLVEFDPALENVQAQFEFALAKIDTNIERFADSLSGNAQRVRDAVTRPVDKFSVFASGIKTALEVVVPENDQED